MHGFNHRLGSLQRLMTASLSLLPLQLSIAFSDFDLSTSGIPMQSGFQKPNDFTGWSSIVGNHFFTNGNNLITIPTVEQSDSPTLQRSALTGDDNVSTVIANTKEAFVLVFDTLLIMDAFTEEALSKQGILVNHEVMENGSISHILTVPAGSESISLFGFNTNNTKQIFSFNTETQKYEPLSPMACNEDVLLTVTLAGSPAVIVCAGSRSRKGIRGLFCGLGGSSSKNKGSGKKGTSPEDRNNGSNDKGEDDGNGKKPPGPDDSKKSTDDEGDTNDTLAAQLLAAVENEEQRQRLQSELGNTSTNIGASQSEHSSRPDGNSDLSENRTQWSTLLDSITDIESARECVKKLNSDDKEKLKNALDKCQSEAVTAPVGTDQLGHQSSTSDQLGINRDQENQVTATLEGEAIENQKKTEGPTLIPGPSSEQQEEEAGAIDLLDNIITAEEGVSKSEEKAQGRQKSDSYQGAPLEKKDGGQ